MENTTSASCESVNDVLIPVDPVVLVCTALPLALLAALSHFLGLGLERRLLIGIVRAFVQLMCCGYILKPLFVYGVHQTVWAGGLVLLYLICMTILAAHETSQRTRYIFPNMFHFLLVIFGINISWVSVFAFGILLKPVPLWDPHYSIPIVGMLLGNCINGVALSLNHILSSLKERASDMELLLSFGANVHEAASDCVVESIRVGAMPICNGLAVIGIISIPGMMTGQILGGTSVVDAAKYQILITYLIAICAISTILMEVLLAVRVGYDVTKQRLQTDKFLLRSDMGRKNILQSIKSAWSKDGSREKEPLLMSISYDAPRSVTVKDSIEVKILQSNNVQTNVPLIQVRNASLSFMSRSDSGLTRSTLFHNRSLSCNTGEFVLITGPSGTGKTQLLKLIASLIAMDGEKNPDSDLLFRGRSYRDYSNQAQWRRKIRYVSQSKVNIPGTPLDFIEKISSLQSWRSGNDEVLSADDVIRDVSNYVDQWDLDSRICLKTEWTKLSGGEAQRVFCAIALSSRPSVLLMDESTSSLDKVSKVKVEQSVMASTNAGTCVLWISHDAEQIERLSTSV